MAERRMFHTAVVESDAFLDMTPAAQALYFHIGMHADDDGFVNGPRQVCRTVGAPLECLQELIDGSFILWFDGVCVVKHFRMANTLQNDRVKQLRYPDIAKQIYIQPNRIYTLTPGKKRENLFYTKEKNIRDINRKTKQLLESKWNPKGNKPNTTKSNLTKSNRIQSNQTESNLTQPAVGGGLPDAPEGDERAGVPDGPYPPTTYDDNRENEIFCHCEERSDAAIRKDPAEKRILTPAAQAQNDTEAGSSVAPESTGQLPLKPQKESVINLSLAQLTRLYETIGFQNAMRYIDKLARFIRERNATIKDHYATILKWWEEDGGIYL